MKNCARISRYLLFFLTLSIFPTQLFSQNKRTQGWIVTSATPKLLIDNIVAYSTDDGSRFRLPSNLSLNQEIDFYLMLGDFYLRRKDKIGIANILYDLRTKKGEYSLADAIITSLWKSSQGEDAQAIRGLDLYIQKEPNTYFRNLAKNARINMFQGGEDEKKTIIQMECNKSKSYYSICRVFRLQYYLDLPNGDEKDMNKPFVNIMRVISPFFEDPKLEWIPLLETIDEDLPAKLAFMGFLKESVHFQQIILDFEKAADGEWSENSLERMSFFATLAGDYRYAEDSLNAYMKLSKNKKSSYNNRIYLKLGFLAHLQKEYKRALDYYLQLDFSNWSSNILHPILNEPISITGAKDLISVTVWRLQGADIAIKALQKIVDPEKLTEDDLWPKLRVAQILMDQNHDLSAKIADEIIYMSQGKGWKRLEYAATILQGHNQIYKREYRKATVEFTKSRGILDEENKFFSSEFMRNFGFVFAHAASGKRGPVTGHIKDGLNDLNKNILYEDFYSIRNYRPTSFSTELFFEQAIQFWKEEGDSWSLLETLHSYDSFRKRSMEKEKPQGLQQIPFAESQFRFLSGFQTPKEAKFFDSTYANSRETEAGYIGKQNEESVLKTLESVKTPTVAIIPYKESTFVFFINPKEPRRTAVSWKELRSTRLDAPEILEAIRDFTSNAKEFSGMQVYLNEYGLVAFRNLRRDFKEKEIGLFFRYGPPVEEKNNLVPVAWYCPKSAKQMQERNVGLVETAYFEGSRILKEKERIHIWDFEPNTKSAVLSDLSWSCRSSEQSQEDISINRLMRRIDYRTVPKALLYTDKTLPKTWAESYTLHQSWVQFWFLAGVKTIYFKPKLPELEAGFQDLNYYLEDGFIIHQVPR